MYNYAYSYNYTFTYNNSYKKGLHQSAKLHLSMGGIVIVVHVMLPVGWPENKY